MQGRFPFEYMDRVHVAKEQAAIFADMDAYTWEVPRGQVPGYCFSVVMLPPFFHQGHLAKGILAVNQGDWVLDRWPQVRDLFYVIADSHFASHSFCERADAVAGLYDNPARRDWFYATHPQRRHQVILPMQLGDWTNEWDMAPDPNVDKDLPFLCVARVIVNKNLPFLARAIKIYHRKYGRIRVAIPNGYDTDWANYTGLVAEEWAKVESICGHVDDYFLRLACRPGWEMPALYNRAKVLVLASLLEGKPRVLYEAQACDVPVVCCEHLNHWYRGDQAPIAAGAGLLAPFDEESFADTMHEALAHWRDFQPRQSFLNDFSGRAWSLRVAMAALPGAATNWPGFDPGQKPTDNPWLMSAVAASGWTWHAWIYGGAPYHLMMAPGADHGPWLDGWQRHLRLT